jgi:PAS domain S-box-containing protein
MRPHDRHADRGTQARGKPLSTRLDAWLAFLLSTASDNAIIVLDPGGRIVQWLGGAERRFGYTQAEAVGLDFGMLFTPEDRQRGLDRQEMAVAAASNRSEDDRWHLRKDGGRFWGSGLLEVVREEDGSVCAYCKVLRDRTDVRTQVTALQNRLAFAEEEGARRAEFLASLGHELRNLLGPLQNATTTLLRSTDESIRSRSAQLLQRQLDSMSSLLDDLDEKATAIASGPRLRLAPVLVQEALELAADGVRTSTDLKRQALVVTMPPAPIVIQADASRLQQMLLNLLGNASKYTPEGGAIHLTATVEAGEAVMRITDNGTGIPQDVLPHIFDLFTRGNPVGRIPGMGVGLAVVRELASLHGGGVEARSPGTGKGSVFTLRLPIEAPRRSGGGAG